ncbi:MAG: IPT/TIG domain-containing protein [Actinomycetota bacterium]
MRSFLADDQLVEGDGEHHLGFKLAPEADYPQAELAPKLEAGEDLPAAVDLSSQLPPIGDQGSQGSCVGWSSTYYYKTWSEKQEHTGWNLANANYQFSPSWTYNQINGGQDGGANFPDAFSLLQNKGAVDIAEFAYTDSNYTRQPTSAQNEAARPYRIPSGWSAFWNQSTYGPFTNPNNIANAKAWLDQGKMLVMGIPIYNDFPNYGGNPAKAYYDYNGSSGIAGGHGVCIVGYDDNANPGGSDADHRGGFKMVNSWGYNWNGTNHGFVYLSYDFAKRYVWEAWSMGDLSGDGPSISSLNPGSGSVGTSVQVNGNNFGALRRSARVTFNGTAANQVGFTNARVTATVPSGATSGPVVVYDWDGAASNGVNFTVGGAPPSGPGVTGIDPNQGINITLLDVAVSGSGFVSGSQVRLSRSGSPDIEATGEAPTGSTRIDCTVNLAGAAEGAWDVVVTNPDASSGTLSGGFTVTGPPGEDFEPNDGIAEAYGPLQPDSYYSSHVAAAYDDDYYYTDVPSGTDVIAVELLSVPAGCDYDLYVYDQYGQQVASSINESNLDELIEFHYPDAARYYLHVYPYDGFSTTDDYLLGFSYGSTQQAPSISGLSPSSGTRGSAVTILGSGFGASRGSSVVRFGSRACASSDYLAWSSTSLRVKVPSGVGGRPQVTVTTGGGTSGGVAFSVIPQISTLSRSWGYPGTWLTVNGQGFGGWSSGVTKVYFGSQRATRYRSWSNNQVVVQVPSGVQGTVQVKVQTAGGKSAGKSFTIHRR